MVRLSNRIQSGEWGESRRERNSSSEWIPKVFFALLDRFEWRSDSMLGERKDLRKLSSFITKDAELGSGLDAGVRKAGCVALYTDVED